MSSLKWQKGEGRGAVIFWLLFFLAGGVLAKEMIPAKIKDMQLKDHMDEIAKLYPRGKTKFFRDEIFRRAKDLDIPLKKEDVQVDKSARRVRMKVKYVKKLNLIITTIDWTFEHNLERDLFII